jgi:hypothetical protein
MRGSALRTPPSFRQATRPLARVGRQSLAPIDAKAFRDDDQFAKDFGLPVRFAAPIPVALTPDNSGTWETLADGSWLWRLRVGSPGALSLNLAFTRVSLPPSARLWVYDPTRTAVHGPYARRDASRRGRLFTPLTEGSEAVVELHVAASEVRRVRLEIGSVNYGYRAFGTLAKQGSCNVDVVCADGDPWRDQIRAVGVYTLLGQWTCTGTLLNNTSGDLKPYFLTAYHCGLTSNNDDTIVVYWNYQSPTCGALSGGSLAETQSGAALRASHEPSDFALLELNRAPDADVDAYYAGWDASGTRPTATVVIHHPNTEEKAISFDRDAPSDGPNVLIDGATALTHWRVNAYEKGTTEPGSSGACLFDAASKLCIGDLTGGTAACSLPGGFDAYGKLAVAWEGGGTAGSRLRDWLDPIGSGSTKQLVGTNSGSQSTPCVAGADTMCLLNGRYEAKVKWTNQFNGTSGQGGAVPLTDFSGFFYFTDAANLELMLKILELDGAVKVFYGQLTNLQFELAIRDTLTGLTKTYRNGPNDCGAIDQNFAGLLGDVIVVDKSLDPVPELGEKCRPDDTTLCLLSRRFTVKVDWRNQFNGQSGHASKVIQSDLAGHFYYTDPRNVELLAKTLDFGDRILFIWGALSDLEYTITVTDSATDKTKTYVNPAGQYCGGLDNDFNGTGGGGGGGSEVSETEPNDTPEQAQLVGGTPPLTVNGSIQTSDVGTVQINFQSGAVDDVEDLYKVTTTATGLAISLGNFTADLDLYVLDAQVENILDSANGPGTETESLNLATLPPGTYYIGVAIYDPEPSAPSSDYKLTLTGSF